MNPAAHRPAAPVPARALAAATLALALAAAGAHAAPRPLPPRVVEAFAPARAMQARGAADSADAALAALADRARATRDDTLRAAALFERGARFAWFGRMGPAIATLTEARDLAWRLRDSTRWVQSSQWLAFALNATGRFAEGGPVARRALPAAVATGDERAERYLRLSYAYAALLEGHAVTARERYRAALPLFERARDDFGVGEALLGLGRAYSVTGPRDSALALFRHAARRAVAAGQPRTAASAYNNLAGEEFLAGDPEAATEAWRRAAATLYATGDLGAYFAASGNLCLALSQRSLDEDARAVADTILARARRSGSSAWIAQAQERLGEVDLSSGRPAAAAVRFRAALAPGAALPLEDRVQRTMGLVQALVPLDSTTTALALYDALAPEAAGRIPPVIQVQFDEAGSLAAFEAGQYARATAIVRGGLAVLKKSDYPEFETGLERMAARAFAAEGRHAEARAHLERADRAWQRQRVRARGLEWRTSLSHSALLGSAWAEVELGHGLETRRDRIAPALAAIERIRSTLLLELAAGPGGPHAAMPPVTLDQLQHGVLGRGEVLLLAWVGNRESWLVAVTRDTAAATALPGEAGLERDLDLLRGAIESDPPFEPGALDALLADAGRRLFGPFVPLLRRADRVVFVPSGPLQRLPLEAVRLPLGPGGALVPLGVTHALARAPSASVLALARSRAGRTSDPKAPALLVVAHARDPGGRPLPGALGEARALEGRYRGVRLLENPHDTRSVLAAFRSATVVHVAAHAAFDPASPWRSSLQLGDGAPVLARDLLGVPTRAELCVLSACQTAGGDARGTGGMEGLSAALLCAGARGVVATLWPVEDRATRRFVEAFYEEAERAPDAATALVRTRARLRDAGAGVRDWAAFTLVGDPGARLRPERKRLSLPGIPGLDR